ncbi:MAG TPA: sulfite exporter TauE/SafE family protein [Gemmataceae bacterium]|nr:sulfite exporter TauE/SafE family protein [Gemmataceae bacterium]
MPSELDLVAVLAILFLATPVRFAFGFGNALIAMPLLVLVIPVEAAAPLVALTSTVIAGVVIARHGQQIHLRSAGQLVASSLIGTPVGILFLRHAAEQVRKATLAVVIVSFSAFCLLRPPGEWHWPGQPVRGRS